MSLKPPLTGTPLRDWIANPSPMRNPIAEGFLYEKSCIIVSADSGLGKSVISLQAALELSSGFPLFRRFELSRSYRIYYILKERPKEEMGERIQSMQQIIKWNPDNLIIDDQLQSFNLAREANFRMIIDRILAFHPDIIFIDPIYAGTPGLSKDEVASAFTNFLTILEQDTGALIWLNHHITKMTYDRDGQEVNKDDPMYGSAWIKAHVTGSYLLTRTSSGTVMTNKKSSHSNLLNKIELDYDPDTYLSTAKGKGGTGHDRMLMFLNRVKAEKRRFNIEEVMAETDLSRPRVLSIFKTPPSGLSVINLSTIGTKGLYEVL